MAVIAVANSKGGSGKTTTAVLLATEFARCGMPTTLLDCDDLKLASAWAKTSGLGGNLSVGDGGTVASLTDHLRRLRHLPGHVIVDLSAARDVLVALAIGLSDLVLVPVQGCAMDSRGALNVLELVDFVGSNARIRVNRAVVLSRVHPFVTTRALLGVKSLLASHGVPVVATPVIERSVYRDMFGTGGTLYDMDGRRVSNLAKAQANMQSFARDVAELVLNGAESAGRAPFARMCYDRARREPDLSAASAK
ncbi:ParA family protein [Rhizobium sp. TRM95111]|uniref:ParA family protein n=1 Tax=Rhizobium alarense TaxID=2846851 RepID=UPI001F242B17|nr:ParA family protein [Rhizobium alarense]MCF3639338.1 ParA family protein [Rhizobium alarense]